MIDWLLLSYLCGTGGLVLVVIALTWAVQSVQRMWLLLMLSGLLGASMVLLCICVAVTDGVMLIQLMLTLAIEFEDSAIVAVIEPLLEQLAAPRYNPTPHPNCHSNTSAQLPLRHLTPTATPTTDP